MESEVSDNATPTQLLASESRTTNGLDFKQFDSGRFLKLTQFKEDYNVEDKANNNSNTKDYKIELVWRNVIIFAILHSLVFYNFYLLFTGRAKWTTEVFQVLYGIYTVVGVTAGAHRLWAHRTYTANLPLRIYLMVAQSGALQNHIYEWARDHRVHHKFTDTNADPHNSTRGFFFSHMGWLMCKKHKDVIAKGKAVDMSDVLRDPVVRFQMRYYVPLAIMLTFVIPSVIPWYFFGEDGWISFVSSVGRYVLTLNGTWTVNSAAHIWGTKPYDRTIRAAENTFVASYALGEGWHNYHHTFPWDYKAAELGNYSRNITTGFLDFMAKIGWATELKTVSEEIIRSRINRTGDGTWSNSNKYKTGNNKNSHKLHEPNDAGVIWGWGDKDMTEEEFETIQRFNRQKA